MIDNLKLCGENDEKYPDFHNIAPWFKQQYAIKGVNIKKQYSGQIARLLGCDNERQKLGLDMHNALYDVYSILAGLRMLGFTLYDKVK